LEPQWESFRQRIVLTYNLGHMSRDDVSAYIDYRLKIASGEGCLAKFSAQAKEDIYFATQGIPRLINVLCDNALLTGYTRKVTEISHELMTDVLKEASLWDFGAPPTEAKPPQEEHPLTPQPAAATTDDTAASEPVFVHMDKTTPPPSSDEVINLKDIEEELDRASKDIAQSDLPSLGDKPSLQESSPEDDETVDFQPGYHIVTPPEPVKTPQRTPIYELSQDHITPQGVLSAMSAARPTAKQRSIDQIDNKLHMSDLLIAHKDRGGPITEEFRALRTSLLATATDERFCYLITSPETGDGKTLTCLNLALVMIERLDYKTIVVDCDLRKGAISRYLKGRRSPGAAEVLRGAATIKDVTQPTAYPNMFFIPAGKAHPNEVGELVGGPDLMEFVTDLRRLYDYVIIDTPPINSFSDVGMLGLATGEALLVVRMNRTKRESVLKSIRLLNAANVKLAGLVLTDRRHFLPGNVYRY
ncbi:MAG TPA: polysaccharide biosynthesis tyrosine autokinase, partial [Phycisphaerae bacterium]|nr:polysaccharide biosynthesis tyrosine autokinase [Phycisphaerae bacterium]